MFAPALGSISLVIDPIRKGWAVDHKSLVRLAAWAVV